MTRPPNILFIMSDQHRYDCLGASRAYPVKTPNLDRLAEEGVFFESAYTPHPLCCPARQSLLNGRRAEAFGTLWNFDLGPTVSALDPQEFSWPRQLQESGYRTGFIGKWHVHPKVSPLGFGFERYISNGDYRKYVERQYPDVKYSSGFFGEPDPLPLKDTMTHWLANQAVSLIEQFTETGDPWHIRLDFVDPHLPCRPAEPFASMYSPESIPAWPTFEETFYSKPQIQQKHMNYWGVEHYSWEDWAPIVARYYAVISQMDDAIGVVLKRLQELGLNENTIVVYTSDHGDLCGSHRLYDKHYVMYEDVVKVPLIVRWPGQFPQNLRCNEFVYNILDLPPTMLELTGCDIPDFLSGHSLVPLLRGNEVSDWRQEVLSSYNGQMFGLFSQRMIRDREFKYIWNGTDIDELYDLREDPHELCNISQNPKYAEVIRERREKMHRILLQDGDKLMNNRWMRKHFYQLAEL